MLAGCVDLADEVEHLVTVHTIVLRQLGVADDCVHGCAQVVGHVEEELGLGVAGLLGHVEGLLQARLLLQLLALKLGHVLRGSEHAHRRAILRALEDHVVIGEPLAQDTRCVHAQTGAVGVPERLAQSFDAGGVQCLLAMRGLLGRDALCHACHERVVVSLDRNADPTGGAADDIVGMRFEVDDGEHAKHERDAL